MLLSEIFAGICEIPDEMKKIDARGVTSDSREFREGDVFVCIKGAAFDGHSFAEKAAALGAAAVVCERKTGARGEMIVRDTRGAYPVLLQNFYGDPQKKMKICAVTGTNGKTTTASLCSQIMKNLGKKCGMIGTLGIDDGCGLVYSHGGPPTVPEPRKLYEALGKMAENGAEFCFVEASSQALAQKRFAPDSFKTAAFTNLTRDHLDYHKRFDNYFLAKRSLFDNCRDAVINISDEYGRKIADYCKEKNIPVKTVSINEKADFHAEFVKISAEKSEFILVDENGGKAYPVRLRLAGEYNVLNAVTAVAICAGLGFYIDEIIAALERIDGVSGRLETLYSGKFTVIRDYAHTDDGLKKCLGALRRLTDKKLICVFGAAGERDAGKRPAMGKAASEFADYLIVTTDNPAREDPQRTIDGVTAGIPENVPFETFIDREKAIFRALELAREGDVVALCGKGHEDYQIIGEEYVHFDEKEIVEKALKK